jgi:hypothetical protein
MNPVDSTADTKPIVASARFDEISTLSAAGFSVPKPHASCEDTFRPVGICQRIRKRLRAGA